MVNSPSDPSEVAVRDALNALLQSRTFSTTQALCQLLRFVVETTLTGDTDDLKESVIGVRVFARDADWDSRTNSVVRTRATRLRDRLKAYYAGEGANDAIEIRLPIGTYVPQFVRRTATPVDAELADARVTESVRGPTRNLRTIVKLPYPVIVVSTVLMLSTALVLGYRLLLPNSPLPIDLPDRIFGRVTSEGPRALEAVKVPGQPSLSLLDNYGRFLFVADNNNRSELQVIDLETFALRAPLPVLGGVTALAMTRDGTKLYVGTYTDGLNIIHLNGQNQTEVIHDGIESRVQDIHLSHDEKTLFLALQRGGLKRLDTESKKISTIWSDRCPQALALDASGDRLYVSCGCEAGQPPVREVVEALDLPSGRTVTVYKGPPMIADRIYLFQKDERLWAAAQDACLNPRYLPYSDGCPIFPGTIQNIFRATDGMLLKSIGSALPGGMGAPEFLPDSRRAITGGRPVRVLDTTFFAEEELLDFGTNIVSPKIDLKRKRIYLNAIGEGKVYSLELPQKKCDPLHLGLAHFWPGDGTANDRIDVRYPLRWLGSARFTPGLVGQAFGLDHRQLELVTPYSNLDGLASRDGSLAGWLKLTGSGSGILAEFTSQRDGSWRLTIGPDAKVTFDQYGAPATRAKSPLQVGRWYHFALIHRNKRSSFFLDGQSEFQVEALSADPRVPLGDKTLRWGPFPGLLDEASVYDRALSTEEIRGIVQTAESCLTGGMRAHQ